MDNVNWEFIHDLEGGTKLAGYVPCDREGQPLGKSGVTVAAGFDLGGRSVNELYEMGLNGDLVEVLGPYCGKTGDTALAALAESPLEINETHGRQINNALKKAFHERLRDVWNKDSDVPWENLDERCATVVMSVAWQYGSPWEKCRKFWKFSTSGDWKRTVNELRDFGDQYRTRRNKEAEYLESFAGLQSS